MRANLTVKVLQDLRPASRIYEVIDHGGTRSVAGLRVRVRPSGDKTYFVRFFVHKKERTVRLGGCDEISLNQAREMAASVRHQARDAVLGRAQVPTGKEWEDMPTIRQFIESVYSPHISPRRKAWKEAHERIQRCFQQILDWPMDDSRLPGALQSYQDRALKSGLAHATINKDLTNLRAVFTYAIKHDLISLHPMRKIERLREDNTRVRYLGSMAPDEPKRFWDALDRREERIRTERDRANEWRSQRGYRELPDLRKAAFADHLKPICILAADTGLRQGEIFRLEWRDVDSYANVVRVRSEVAKSGKSRAVPMTKRVRSCLEAWREQSVPGGIVFKGKEGAPLTDIKTAWRKLMADADIKDFRFHDLRHDFASRLAMRGVPLFQISRLLGHSDTRTSEKYSHLSPAVEQAAIDMLDREIPSRVVPFPFASSKDAGSND